MARASPSICLAVCLPLHPLMTVLLVPVPRTALLALCFTLLWLLLKIGPPLNVTLYLAAGSAKPPPVNRDPQINQYRIDLF